MLKGCVHLPGNAQKRWILFVLCFILIVQLPACGGREAGQQQSIDLVNVSFDSTRELYRMVNKAFASSWEAETGGSVSIKQSHGGSGKQARSVIDGLQADVVSLALSYDLDRISAAGIVAEDWQMKFPYGASPYTSTIVFLVRSGNPKGIHDWNDLIRPGIQVITPNPKTSGGARLNYLAAWGYALQQSHQDEQAAIKFISALYRNVPILSSGARDATNTFVRQEIGDVLIAWESEALLTVQEIGQGEFEIVYPSLSVMAEPVVAVVDQVVSYKGTRAVAEAYIEFMYSEEGQRAAAAHYFRPRMPIVLQEYSGLFPAMKLLSIDDSQFGGWAKVQKKHFSDGGLFDEIYENFR